MTLQDFGAIGGGATVVGLVVAGLKYFTDRYAAESATRAKEKEAQQALTVEERRLFPAMIQTYNTRIAALELAIEKQANELRAQMDRMEREAIRMRGHLVQLQADYLRLMTHADKADNLLKFHLPTWTPHNMPRHDYIPDFGDEARS